MTTTVRWLTGNTITQDEFNQMLQDHFGNWVVSGLTPSAGSGLNLTIASGWARIAGRDIAESGCSQTMVDSQTNYVFLIYDGTYHIDQDNTPGSNPYIYLAKVTTSGGVITNVEDHRHVYERVDKLLSIVNSLPELALFVDDQTRRVRFRFDGTDTHINAYGNLIIDQLTKPYTDNTFDLGTDALRWKSLKLGTSIVLGGDVTLTRGAANRLDLSGALSLLGPVTLDITSPSFPIIYLKQSGAEKGRIEPDGTHLKIMGFDVDIQFNRKIYPNDTNTLDIGGSGAEWKDIWLLGQINWSDVLLKRESENTLGVGSSGAYDSIKCATITPTAYGAQSLIDHGSITGLGDDDHSIYWLTAGRAADMKPSDDNVRNLGGASYRWATGYITKLYGQKMIFEQDNVEVSATTETKPKSLRMSKASTNGLEPTKIHVVAEMKASAGTASLKVYVDGSGTPSLTLTSTSTSYEVKKGSFSVSWADDSIHLLEFGISGSGGTGYNKYLEVSIEQ